MKKYFYSYGKEKQGPFSFEELKKENITKETLIWFEGLEDWIPAKNIKELEEILQLIPPPIPAKEIKANTGNIEFEKKIDDSANSENSKNDASGKIGMFSKSFSFEGRIRRTEYGISFIIYAILATIVNLIIESNVEAAIIILAYIPLLWFFFAQGAKRCHDMGNNGWYQIIPFYALWMIFADGEKGLINRYGRNPKI